MSTKNGGTKRGKSPLIVSAPKAVQTLAEIPVATNPLGVRAAYTNNMDITGGVLDVRLDFFELFPVNGTLNRELRASVVMSTQHFRAMLIALNQQLPMLQTAAAQFEKAISKAK